MADVIVRAASAEDIPAITAIYRPAVLTGTASFEVEPPSQDEMRRRFDAIVSGGYPYLAAVIDGQLVGYSYASAFRPRPAYRFTVENSVYVAPGHHGQGIGRALLDALITACTERGYRQMIAVIGDSAQRASIGLHHALGFTYTGTLRSVGFKHGGWLDIVLMQLSLGDGENAPPA